MGKEFIIIEIKDKDLFVIYDVENKGVCCCTRYTIKQLMENGCFVLGAKVDAKNKLIVQEMDLNGNRRAKKATNCCDNLTKRSATTIMNGLNEKHYPRVKQSRDGAKGVFESGAFYEYHSMKNNKEVTYPCMFTNSGTMVFVFAAPASFHESAFVNKNINKYTPLTNLSVETKQAFLKCVEERLELISFWEKQRKLEEEMRKLSELHTQKEKIADGDILVADRLYKADLQRESIAKVADAVTGDEEFRFTFMKNESGFSKEQVAAIISKSNKPIVYTHGFKWKSPTTYEVPMDKESAIQRVLNGYTDVTIDKNRIDVNEFSGSDLW